MDLNDSALKINAIQGLGIIRLGFWLVKKPSKTAEEASAAKAFLRTFCISLSVVLFFVVLLFILTGYTMDGVAGYQGDYDESRTGRIENGQIRYVKNELYYISPEEIGLSAEELPEGTHINLYFDAEGNVVAAENADEIEREVQSRVILTISAMGVMVVVLIAFAIIARKTFGKPWYQWVTQVRNEKNLSHDTN